MEKSIFDLQYILSKFQVVQITTLLLTECEKVQKMPTKTKSLKNRGLVPTIKSKQNFVQACGFSNVLDNFELITYMKFLQNP